MEDVSFDQLAKAMGAGSRRGLLRRLGAVLPVLGGVGALLNPVDSEAKGRRKRRKKAHHDRLSAAKKHKKKKHKKTCKPQTLTQTCAGKCGTVTNNCKKSVDCGSCACTPSCPACQVCDDTSRQCIPDPTQQGEACGDGRVCQADGSCACDATSCPAPTDQCFESFCTAIGVCDKRPKDDGTACSTGNLCTIDDTCVGGVCTEGPHRVCPTLPNQCQKGVCNPQTGDCEPTNKEPFTPCDDGNPCTTNDHCNVAGECVGFPVSCQGGTICCPSGPSAGQCKGGDFAGCNADIQCCSGVCSSLVLACVGE